MIEHFEIQLFEEKNLEEVAYINWTCLPENYSRTFFLELYHRFPKTFIVAVVDHKVIGYIMCRIETGFSELKRWNLIKKGHIVSIAVLPEYRSSGVGYALLVKALEGMGEYRASESFLEVRKSNVAAINLYKKLDFKPVKSINGYYKDGEAAYVMARSLT